MKYGILLLCSVFIIVSCKTSPDSPNAASTPITYSKNDLRKIRWLEGNWKGMDGQNPFYEIYKFTNDSTIEITSYQWNGSDSSHSSKSLLLWKGDRYYLGEDLNYNVTEISDSIISMNPNYKANNSILWKIKTSDAWMAILKSKSIEKTYNMERVNHFEK